MKTLREILDLIYGLRDKRARHHETEMHSSNEPTADSRLADYNRKMAWNSGYRQALEDVSNGVQYGAKSTLLMNSVGKSF